MSEAGGLEKPWRDVVSAGHTPAHVYSLVQTSMASFSEDTWNDLDLAIVVLRGGALLSTGLKERCLATTSLRASRREDGVQLTNLPRVEKPSGRLLLCDVLCDTGSTFAECVRWARQAAPGWQIDLLCVYSTAAAISRLSLSNRVFCAEVTNQNGWSATAPIDIPYDFGEVAARCGLV